MIPVPTLRELAEKATKGPWRWYIHDYSYVSLVGPNEDIDIVLSVSPCASCLANAKAKTKEPVFEWGLCNVPETPDADFIARANPVTLLAVYEKLDQIFTLSHSQSLNSIQRLAIEAKALLDGIAIKE